MGKSKTLYLIDSMAMAYRSYFALQRAPLITSKGENVSAVFGFLKSVLRILDEQKPDYFAAVFDTPHRTFRHEMYPEYKATREKMPEEMSDQLPRIKEMLEILNIPIVEVPGFEADDVMGALAKLAEPEKIETYLVTGDKDFMQLVSPLTRIYNPKRINENPEVMDELGVLNKVGLPPEKIIDYLGLMGDSSDNVPGVPGIGPKGAYTLLSQFKNMDEIYKNLDKVKSESTKNKLAQNKELAFLSRKLVTIDTEVKVPVEIINLTTNQPDKPRAFALMKELEFNSLLNRFAESKETQQVEYVTIKDMPQLQKLAANLNNCKQFTLDLETTDVDPMRAEIVGLSFSWKEGEAFYVPVDSAAGAVADDLFSKKEFTGLPAQKVLDILNPTLIDQNIKKCGQNIKYDLMILSRVGIEVQGVDFDTMVASYLINPSLRQHNLDALALQYFNYQKVPTSDLIGKGKNQISMADVPVEKVSFYACEDADYTQRLRTELEKGLADRDLRKLFDDVELPLLPVLMKIEKNGVSLDVPFLHKMSKQLDLGLSKNQEKIFKLAGQEFNINSPKQLSEIMFTKLDLPVIKKTKTGPSTDVSVLETLAKDHELPQEILEFRQLSKLKSTYVDALPRLINPKTGRVHTSYNQTVAATGRLSSSNPNLQNIPIRTEIGRQIRKAFVPIDSNHILIDADYSQIELRIMAHLSKDKALIKAFEQGADIHRSTAARVFKVEPEDVTDDMRRRAKEVNFGIMYGMGAFGLSNRLDIPQDEAEMFIYNYFSYYPGIQEFMEESKQMARDKGYVTTLLNRRRYLPDINSDNRRMREFAERNAINTPIQGTAADLIKVAMINISQKLKEKKLKTKMIMQVHDELVFETPNVELDDAMELIRYEMENAIELDVAIKVDIDTGMNWLEAH
ncbi:DNA polymerase I [candidate division KSB1 bacterium]|nr:DNA polymerase I [candidate division KSB1 bacterium]MBL7094106.1 DNA polymerase I [candidate division KSB1 bacterium]